MLGATSLTNGAMFDRAVADTLAGWGLTVDLAELDITLSEAQMFDQRCYV
jgi:hypothetical protein